ncbi:site-specific integrase [Burkholderia cepacia]|uniref:site-specific integrase n=1 Tax=Burkholderia cepacia TaxID=292 RepID=UPI001CF29D20|nr:site-specific integrase [Burkholderia cepacia]MCA7893472.1 site-specific integrase [Burkholderia cepacia]
MTTFLSQAEDLAAYCRFLEGANVDWRHFPSHKSLRPTYRFRSHLVNEVWAGTLAPTTAKRRIRLIVRFYRWLVDEGLIQPEYAPWKDGEVLIQAQGTYGQTRVIAVKTTDLGINVTQQEDEYSEYIRDGGALKPLNQLEQEWLLTTLQKLGNTEMTLIHLLALLSGARMQTVLTFRVRDAFRICADGTESVCVVGPGTGVDTKNSKKQTLRIPTWFHEQLRIYARSDRAKIRRERAGDDSPGQYLFLTVRGAPMYISSQEDESNSVLDRKYIPRGQAVRQYIVEYIIPEIRKRFHASFSYRFHDLRATFGVNMVDEMASLMNRREITYSQVLDFVRVRMCHESMVTTERYIKYRENLKIKQRLQDGWENRLRGLVEMAMGVEGRNGEI